MEYYGILAPQLGLKTDFPSIFLNDAAIPEGENFMFNRGVIQKFRLRDKLFSPLLPDRLLKYYTFEKRSGGSNWYLMCLTKRDICYWDIANSRYAFVTPQYTTGVIRVENASKEVYGGINIDDCDDDPIAWADGSGGDVTPARETSNKKENTASVKLTVAAGAGVELLAYHDLAAPVNLSAYDSVGFWFKSSVALSAGDLKFRMDDTAGCGSPIEAINFPAISADTWTWVELAMADPSLCTAIASIGIYQAVDKGAMTLYIDQIVAGDWAGQLKAGDFITIGTTYSSADTWYEVDTVTDTHITLTAVYAGTTAYQQAYKARVTYNGSDTDRWSCATFNDSFFATNNQIDLIQKWTGTGLCADLAGLTTKCKYLATFENHLLAINTYESGTYYPQRIQGCDLNDETNWTTGDATTFDIDSKHQITGSALVKGFFVVFTKESIHKYWYAGGSLIYNGEKVVEGVGCYAPDSIVERDLGVYFYSNEAKFRFFTGFSWDSISDNILPALQDFHPTYEDGIQGIYVKEYNHILWSCPDASSSGYNNLLLCYDLNSANWTMSDVDISCFGSYLSESAYTWDTLPYATWDDWPWDRWDSRFNLAGAPYILAGGYDGYTYRLNFSDTDAGSAYTSYFTLETDLMKKGGLQYRKRIQALQLFVKKRSSGTLYIQTSKDGGGYGACGAGSISLDGTPDILRVRLPCDDSGNWFRHKFYSTGFFEFLGVVYEYDLVGER